MEDSEADIPAFLFYLLFFAGSFGLAGNNLFNDNLFRWLFWCSVLMTVIGGLGTVLRLGLAAAAEKKSWAQSEDNRLAAAETGKSE
ncbi:hypothetical protein [Pseudomonas cannabina]|uniref:Conjugal transfer protein TraA n=1 Tax=Pseudomonas cannabina TaxID=86840 RepID=A0A0P9R704_PSECA|nr:hypothetical protein [Pseudomonas cannabina]KAA8699738.1 hypothetical protein F4W70_26455 [Pseudomonas cannabina]KPW79415.1 hypothetical protein ALO81_200010 [Pseudomonas cannabina]RMN17741.1 hypothetical protein ALQ64_00777 [Pseudomonas cannabina]SDR54438.1 hypothetical protein SAMN05216597_5690 [Pseudomonas cannabina]